MSTVTESVEVDVSVPIAYSQWTHFEAFPWFMEAVESVTQHGDAMTRWEIDIAGRRCSFDVKITEQHRDRRLAWESVGGPRHAGTVTFHRLDDDRTRVTLRLEADPEGVLPDAAQDSAGAQGFLARRARRDLRRFKEFVEQRSVLTGTWRAETAPPMAASY